MVLNIVIDFYQHAYLYTSFPRAESHRYTRICSCHLCSGISVHTLTFLHRIRQCLQEQVLKQFTYYTDNYGGLLTHVCIRLKYKGNGIIYIKDPLPTQSPELL